MSPQLFGDKRHFAIEVGESPSPTNSQLRRVDIWAAGHWITCDDNHAYIPQFSFAIRSEVARLRAGVDITLPDSTATPQAAFSLCQQNHLLQQRFLFLDWGPTTDNILAYAFRVGSQLLVPFKFWRPEHANPKERELVFVADCLETEFIDVMEKTVCALGN